MIGGRTRRRIARWGQWTAALAAALLVSAGAPIAVAAQDEAGFQSYLLQLRQRAIAAGVRPATADAGIAGLTLNTRVVELDRAQPGGTDPSTAAPPFAPYYRAHVDAARIERGRDVYKAQRGRLASIERDTGVPESVMVAIWGNETNYGAYTGNFDLLRSLASLAYDGRRRELFAGEFVAALGMLDRGVPRDRLKGSWAGATGNPQFLPSAYLRLARDADGDGQADIWNSAADTLASIGNYFVDAGWRRGQPWGLPVSVSAGVRPIRAFATGWSRRAARGCSRGPAGGGRWRNGGRWA